MANDIHHAGEQAVWICNCKHFVKDHVVPAELDEAERNLRLTCSEDDGGFVWSRKWQKAFGCESKASSLADSTGLFCLFVILFSSPLFFYSTPNATQLYVVNVC